MTPTSMIDFIDEKRLAIETTKKLEETSSQITEESRNNHRMSPQLFMDLYVENTSSQAIPVKKSYQIKSTSGGSLSIILSK